MNTLICDMQFGSTGKGLLAGYLAKKNAPQVAVCAWGPNAGHTFIDKEGNKMITTMLPIGTVSPDCEYAMIGPGAAVHVTNLLKEFEEYKASGMIRPGVQLLVHECAAVIDEQHDAAQEAGNGLVGIGSTMKGTAVAQVRKMMRPTLSDSPRIAKDDPRLAPYLCGTAHWLSVMNQHSGFVQIEGAQGYSLSIHHGFYPYTTSRDTTKNQILADCAIPGHWHPTVHGCARTFPIRVANRFNADGDMIGTSGPCYSDQKELDWQKDLGMQPELTTVTKLPRRIFSFSFDQMHEAYHMMGVNSIFLNFANYMRFDKFLDTVRTLEEMGMNVDYIGVGPTETDVAVLKELMGGRC